MAFPVTQTSSSGAQNTSTTSHPVTLPSGVTAGDLILVCFSLTDFSGTLTATATAGWTLSVAGRGSAAGNSSPTSYYAWKIATGSDALTFTSSANAWSTYVALRISGATGVTGAAESHGDSAASNDPPSLTVTSASYKWIAFFSNNGGAVATAAPTGFTNLLTQASAGTAPATNVAEKDFTGATVDPAGFTSASPSGWTARTIAIAAAAVGAGSFLPRPNPILPLLVR